MPKILRVQPHLSIEELEAGYRQAKGVTERNHYQVIWLVARGKRCQEVAEVTGYNVERVRQIVRAYNEQGVSSLVDQRPGKSGRKRLLSPQQETELQTEVEAAFAEGHPWNGVEVAQRMGEVLARKVHPSRGWEVLKRWQHRLKQPRRQHVKRDVTSGEAFKKSKVAHLSSLCPCAAPKPLDHG